MENNKQPQITESNVEEYTPLQRTVLTLLQWGAWGTAFMAVAMILRS